MKLFIYIGDLRAKKYTIEQIDKELGLSQKEKNILESVNINDTANIDDGIQLKRME